MPDNLTSLLQPVMLVTGREMRTQSVVLVQHSTRWEAHLDWGEASAEGIEGRLFANSTSHRLTDTGP
jgi:hypothetical protein